MEPFHLVQWAARALSFFNTIAFLWLGLAVLLNAQRRVAGTWFTGAGLLGAGLFFAGHTTLLGRELGTFNNAEMAFWWHVLWVMFVGPPFTWYVVIGWYAGVLGATPHRARLVAVGLLGAAALALPAVAGLLPSYAEVVRGKVAPLLTVGGMPVATLVYPAYGALCFGLALAVLHRPGTSSRLMGDLGRRRARPWLVGASVVLLGVSLSASAVAAWLLNGLRVGQLDPFSPRTERLLTVFDLGLSGLLAVAVVLLGRAVVSYEIFTGRTLPRGGLFRQWRNSLILAGGYGFVMGGSLGLPVDPIYRLMLATLLIAAFYGLLSWRSYVERERSMERLRPFVASQRLYEQLLAPADSLEADSPAPFRALCDDVLGAQVAYLVALGPLAPLAGPPLAHPAGALPPLPELGSLGDRTLAPKAMVVPLDPSRFGGTVWAVPLGSERGLVGALLLGEKRDGGLYVQEEIEVARAAGERLLDLRAGSEMARRLMAVQRRRLAESQVLDGRARRVLHDDVLPRLHAALLTLSAAGSSEGAAADAIASLADVHRRLADLLRAMPAPVAPEVAQLGLIGALRRVAEVELEGAFDGVSWNVEPEAERAALDLSPLAAEVMYAAAREAIRNAAHHGRDGDSARPLHLAISAAWRGGLQVTIEDDGVGLGAAAATTGSGQGLALHGTMMAVLGGTLAIEAIPGGRTRVSLVLPHIREPLPPN